MPEQIENRMVVDEAWDEQEYGIPSKRRLKNEMSAYEDAEYGEENEYEFI